MRIAHTHAHTYAHTHTHTQTHTQTRKKNMLWFRYCASISPSTPPPRYFQGGQHSALYRVLRRSKMPLVAEEGRVSSCSSRAVVTYSPLLPSNPSTLVSQATLPLYPVQIAPGVGPQVPGFKWRHPQGPTINLMFVTFTPLC